MNLKLSKQGLGPQASEACPHVKAASTYDDGVGTWEEAIQQVKHKRASTKQRQRKGQQQSCSNCCKQDCYKEFDDEKTATMFIT